jgi:hypothetical protein
MRSRTVRPPDGSPPHRVASESGQSPSVRRERRPANPTETETETEHRSSPFPDGRGLAVCAAQGRWRGDSNPGRACTLTRFRGLRPRVRTPPAPSMTCADAMPWTCPDASGLGRMRRKLRRASLMWTNRLRSPLRAGGIRFADPRALEAVQAPASSLQTDP